MNSFDEVQCEETADAQMIFNMEEMAVYQAWIEEQERKAQAELDKISEECVDEIFAAELDF
jgi:hypothetical protein|tara:strand:+ start:611 stop:793 length:183 start_codon:yes stop_codon:yes gene_type:complete